MLLHENIDTSVFPSHVRMRIYEVEKLVRLGQKDGIVIYTNIHYESDSLQWSIFPQKESLCIHVRSLDSISVPVETHDIYNLTLSQLAAKLAEIGLIY